MHTISNQDLQNVIRILRDYYDSTGEETMKLREKKRKARLLIRKLEKKINQ